MSYEYAWLCKVDFGLVVCFPNLVCIQLSCRLLCNDMKKHIISEGFFIGNPILLFFFFFPLNREFVQQSSIHFESKRARLWAYVSLTSQPRGQSGSTSPQHYSSVLTSAAHTWPSQNSSMLTGADLLVWTAWAKRIKIQMNMEGRPRWQIPCVIFSQSAKIFSPS